MYNSNPPDPSWVQLAIFDLRHFHKDKLPKKKRCTRCKKNLPLSEFGNSKKYKYGKTLYCKSCKKKQQQETKEREVKLVVKQDRLAEGLLKCHICGQIRPFSEFSHKGKRTSDECSECTRLRHSLKYLQKKEEKGADYVPPFAYKQCVRCEDWCPIEYFSKSVRNTDGITSWCNSCSNTRTKLWRKDNRDQTKAAKARRRSRKKNASPSWMNHKEIRDLYKTATQLSKKTGIEHQLDHIHPLENELICGLHVTSNLQILTRSENIRKSNRFTPYVFSDLTPEQQQDPLYNPFWREQGNL